VRDAAHAARSNPLASPRARGSRSISRGDSPRDALALSDDNARTCSDSQESVSCRRLAGRRGIVSAYLAKSKLILSTRYHFAGDIDTLFSMLRHGPSIRASDKHARSDRCSPCEEANSVTKDGSLIKVQTLVTTSFGTSVLVTNVRHMAIRPRNVSVVRHCLTTNKAERPFSLGIGFHDFYRYYETLHEAELQRHENKTSGVSVSPKCTTMSTMSTRMILPNAIVS